LKVVSVGFEVVSQIDDFEKGQTGWESVAALVLEAARAAWWHPPLPLSA